MGDRFPITRTGGRDFKRLTIQPSNTVLKDQVTMVNDLEGLCSESDDQITTYMNSLVWDSAYQKFFKPPYVDCDYVK